MGFGWKSSEFQLAFAVNPRLPEKPKGVDGN